MYCLIYLKIYVCSTVYWHCNNQRNAHHFLFRFRLSNTLTQAKWAETVQQFDLLWDSISSVPSNVVYVQKHSFLDVSYQIMICVITREQHMDIVGHLHAQQMLCPWYGYCISIWCKILLAAFMNRKHKL